LAEKDADTLKERLAELNVALVRLRNENTRISRERNASRQQYSTLGGYNDAAALKEESEGGN
jgi:predicted  nucleic acid-binding Zn-ribbon protein